MNTRSMSSNARRTQEKVSLLASLLILLSDNERLTLKREKEDGTQRDRKIRCKKMDVYSNTFIYCFSNTHLQSSLTVKKKTSD